MLRVLSKGNSCVGNFLYSSIVHLEYIFLPGGRNFLSGNLSSLPGTVFQLNGKAANRITVFYVMGGSGGRVLGCHLASPETRTKIGFCSWTLFPHITTLWNLCALSGTEASFYCSPHQTRASSNSTELSEALYHLLATLQYTEIAVSRPRWKRSELYKVTPNLLSPLCLHRYSGSTGNSGLAAPMDTAQERSPCHSCSQTYMGLCCFVHGMMEGQELTLWLDL